MESFEKKRSKEICTNEIRIRREPSVLVTELVLYMTARLPKLMTALQNKMVFVVAALGVQLKKIGKKHSERNVLCILQVGI